MTGEKVKKDHPDTTNHAPEDNLNAKIGVLTRREVEARILAPMLDAMGEAFGRERVLAVMRETIVRIARKQGAELAGFMGGVTFQHFAESLKFWAMDDALEIDVIEQTEDVLSFNVTRCRYAELYEKLGIRKLGTALSCARDYALIEGFNPDVSLKRTQTIMEGSAHCDFRYCLKK
ncbi:MAG: L-2-amino-thiazoline-4-carboxylic acid hydrolase [Proteobacteria bacterium]|nr:L-2-amino-thiazoline-4-carboxylic acid hydrolase [Pseudomonadota bacterium]